MLKKIIFAILFLLPVSTLGQTAALPIYACTLPGTQAKTSGSNSSNYQMGVIPYCLVTVYLTGTTTIATTTPQSPFKANTNGSIPPIYAAINQGYDVVLSGGIAPNTYPAPRTITGLVPSAYTGCGNPVGIPCGGTGATTAAQALINLGTEQIAQGGTGANTAAGAWTNIFSGAGITSNCTLIQNVSGALTCAATTNAGAASALGVLSLTASPQTLNSIVANTQYFRFGLIGSAYGLARAVQLTPILPTYGEMLSTDTYGDQLASGTWAQSTLLFMESQLALNNFQNLNTFPGDGTDYYSASPGTYPNSYADDTTLAMWGFPSAFTAFQMGNIVNKFVALASDGTGTGGNTSIVGELPMGITPTLGTGFYSAWDTAHIHATGDGALMLPILELTYIKALVQGAPLSSNITHFISVAPALKLALSTIPRDGTTGCVVVTPGSEWVPWAFEEEPRKTGLDAMGCILYWQAATDMAAMYGAAGDTANQTLFQTQANLIAANMGTSSALWDAADGMFYAATIQNHQIDILASSLAVHVGLATGPQKTAIGAWLNTNHSAIMDANGYIKESPSTWATTGFIPPSGGPPYTTNPYGANCYQSAYWSVGNQWVAEALYNSSPALAANLATVNAASADPTMEYYAPSCSGGPLHGATRNLESPIGATAFIYEYPLLFRAYQGTGMATIGSNGGDVSTALSRFGYNFAYVNGLGGLGEIQIDPTQSSTGMQMYGNTERVDFLYAPANGAGSTAAPNWSIFFSIGVATAPSGSCATNGAFVISEDGHGTACLAGTWTSASTTTTLVRIAQVVTAANQTSIVFSSISATYSNLQIACISSSQNGTAGPDALYMRFNADTGANYDWGFVYGGTAVGGTASNADTKLFLGIQPSSGQTAAYASTTNVNINGYATGFYKGYNSSSLSPSTTLATEAPILAAGTWGNTGAITSITLITASGSAFTNGSVCTLYGLL